jgi:hypothetical protein
MFVSGAILSGWPAAGVRSAWHPGAGAPCPAHLSHAVRMDNLWATI